MDKQKLIRKLSEYFKNRKDVAFAYIFGSVAKDKVHSESDIDIGVYFTPSSMALEYESEVQYPGEDRIWSDLEKLSGKQTDLIVLNRAPATLFYAVMQEGILLSANNEGLKSRMYAAISSAAEDYRALVDDYYKIMERSNSLTPIDKERLQRLISFIESEYSDFENMKKVSEIQYRQDRNSRRNVERWAENIVNSSIDIAKTLLASEKRAIPQTYKEILNSLSILPDFDKNMASALSSFSKARNILAHEYLDLRFMTLSKLINEGLPMYSYLIKYARDFISKS